MTRWAVTVILVFASVVWADGPRDDLTPEQKKVLEAKIAVLAKEGTDLYQAAQFPKAAQRWEAVLELRRKLYPAAKYPVGHPDLAESLNNLASAHQAQGR